MCLHRKITYGEFSEFIREKKITYKIFSLSAKIVFLFKYCYYLFTVGGPCEAAQEKGYTVIVDQGFKGEVWMGPQILAHHLLLMLTSDLYASNDPRRYCPNRNSLLHKNILAGEQKLDQCVVNKLNQSNIGLRPCLLD